MSYCRFGAVDADGNYVPSVSDVYVYYGGDNQDDCYFNIHVAHGLKDYPQPERGYEGDWYKLDTAQKCLDKLLWLRTKGYRIPEHALERLREDIKGGQDDRKI